MEKLCVKVIFHTQLFQLSLKTPIAFATNSPNIDIVTRRYFLSEKYSKHISDCSFPM